MSEGMKFDGIKETGKMKARWDLIDIKLIEGLAQVLTTGAAKYDDNNWKKLENREERYYAALMRHLCSWRKGEENDEESGLPHLYHAMACIMFINWKDEEKEKKDELKTFIKMLGGKVKDDY